MDDEEETVEESGEEGEDKNENKNQKKERSKSTSRKQGSQARSQERSQGRSQGGSHARSRSGSQVGKQQHLFLVEFLVDTVTIDACSVDEEVLQGQTCLTLCFLNFPPMEISEKDFDQNKRTGLNKIKFNCGKSLMFAFNENQCEHPPSLTVEITVSKKLEEEENACKVDIGVIKICISEIFRQIVDIAKFKPEKLPASKSIKDCFMLIGPGKRTMGEVSVYIRLSCLGQNVVTEFQCGPDLKRSPVLFRSREGKKMFEFIGNESQEDEEAQIKFQGKTCCGCLPSTVTQTQGGQGDAGQSGPTIRKAYTQGNRVVLDVPDKSNEKGGDAKAINKSEDCKGKTTGSKSKKALMTSMVNTNPDQNCFVLRVGDKGEIPDRGKMILEFRTPKQKILPKVLPPYHEDIGVQTESSKKGKPKKKK